MGIETTRHFTATTYVVCDGATALHDHPRLGIKIPPGGHVDRGELPHETALRETKEETGLSVELIDDSPTIDAPAGRSLPQPRHLMLYDINVYDDGAVGHQHIDHVYFAVAEDRTIEPEDGEVGPDAWEWYTKSELRASSIDRDTVEIGIEAIETVAGTIDRD